MGCQSNDRDLVVPSGHFVKVGPLEHLGKLWRTVFILKVVLAFILKCVELSHGIQTLQNLLTFAKNAI